MHKKGLYDCPDCNGVSEYAWRSGFDLSDLCNRKNDVESDFPKQRICKACRVCF